MVNRLSCEECDLDERRSIPATVVQTLSAVSWECFPEGGGAFLSQNLVLSHNRAPAEIHGRAARGERNASCSVRL